MPRHITWELFLEDYIKPGIPANFQLEGSPVVTYYVSEKAEKIGLKIYVSKNTHLPDIPLKELILELKADNNGYYADLSTINCLLYEHFYSMMCFIADSIQIKNQNIIDAINEAVETLKILISSKKLLSEEKIIGLWGELWVLEKLIKEQGTGVVSLWKGADKAIHDFRLNGIELEVKTTRNEDRVHIIGRLSQLEASPEMDLYLCSIQLVESSIDGLSLCEFVEQICDSLSNDEEANKYFKRQLEKEGYIEKQSRHYTTKYYLRSKPEIMLVKDDFPRITRSMINDSLGKESGPRLSNVHYSVDVTGLGVEFSEDQVKIFLS